MSFFRQGRSVHYRPMPLTCVLLVCLVSTQNNSLQVDPDICGLDLFSMRGHLWSVSHNSCHHYHHHHHHHHPPACARILCTTVYIAQFRVPHEKWWDDTLLHSHAGYEQKMICAPEHFCDIDERFPYIILSLVLCCVQNIFECTILFIIMLVTSWVAIMFKNSLTKPPTEF